jgi:16S rRNA (cytosine1402-N4)-methyltransferase
MLNEVLACLNCRPGKIYADCTLGGAGHARAILEKIMPEGLLIGMDQDMDAIHHAETVLNCYAAHIRLFHGNFIQLPDVLSQLNITGLDGILLDLGLSLHHLESSGRGFSFKRNEPLDMRMNILSDMKAEDMVNEMSAEELEKIFREYGEERWSRRIAQKIVSRRVHEPLQSSEALAKIVCEAVPKSESRASGHRIHPATRVFMALRIAVNRELECLDEFMKSAVNLLNPGGRLCVLSFHSLEDRLVKHHLKAAEKGCICPKNFPRCVCGGKKTLRMLTKKVQRPSEAEIAVNPMSRSTKLRAAERTGNGNEVRAEG